MSTTQVLLRDRTLPFLHLLSCADFLDGGELYEHVKPDWSEGCRPYSEDDARRIVRQLLLAVAHLHKHRVAHCDIKPENILFTSRRVRCSHARLPSQYLPTRSEGVIHSVGLWREHQRQKETLVASS